MFPGYGCLPKKICIQRMFSKQITGVCEFTKLPIRGSSSVFGKDN